VQTLTLTQWLIEFPITSPAAKVPGARCCLCGFIGLLFTLIVLLIIAVVTFIMIVHPESPNYTIDCIVVKEMNLSLPFSSISPGFHVSIKAEIIYRDVSLCNGVLPAAFYQPSNNMTVFHSVLKSNDMELAETDWRALMNDVAKQSVPLTFKLRSPVKFKVGSRFKSWKIMFRFECDVTVDELTVQRRFFRREIVGMDLILRDENRCLDLGFGWLFLVLLFTQILCIILDSIIWFYYI